MIIVKSFWRSVSVQRVLKSCLILLFLASVVVIGAAFGVKRWAGQKGDIETKKVVYFPQGTRLVDLSGALESSGLISNAALFNIYVKFFGDYSKFQAGRYRFEGKVAPKEIVGKISSGQVDREIILQFTIPEGFTLKKTVDRLVSKNIGTKSQFQQLLTSSNFLKKWGIKGSSAEGFIYPATYSFYTKPTPKECLERIFGTFFKQVTSELISKLKGKGLSLRKAVTFASLIELETMHEDEKPKVAEVIWRRIRAGEPLGIDAALIYGIKDYRGDITWAHLKDRKNPYNTRIHKGLPPGPIGSPSISSLEAILNPTNFGYYYYVLIADGKQRHHFSKSLSEHRKHVQLLKKAQRRH